MRIVQRVCMRRLCKVGKAMAEMGRFAQMLPFDMFSMYDPVDCFYFFSKCFVLSVVMMGLMFWFRVMEQGMRLFMMRIEHWVYVLMVFSSMSSSMVWCFMDIVVSWLVVSMITVEGWSEVHALM